MTGLHPDHIRVPELPDSLYSRPTLIWSAVQSLVAIVSIYREGGILKLGPRRCHP